jgi:hypothetical protein
VDTVFVIRWTEEESMKKVCIALLFVTCLFAIMFELTGTDPYNIFTFRAYFKYVTENIKPFPTIDFSGEWWSDLEQIFTYIFRLLGCVVDNLSVLLYGLFPVSVKPDEVAFLGIVEGI